MKTERILVKHSIFVPLNAFASIVWSLESFGISIISRFMHSKNAFSLIILTSDGIFILFIDENAKASFSIVSSIESGAIWIKFKYLNIVFKVSLFFSSRVK